MLDSQAALHLATGPSGQESNQTAGEADTERVVHVGGGATEDVKGQEDDQGEEERVVVEDGEGCSFVFGNLIFLPQNPLILLLLADLLVISELLGHLLGDSFLTLQSNFVLQDVLGVLVGKSQQPSGDQGADSKDDGVGGNINGVDPPIEPDGDCRNDESVSVEKSTRLS